MGRFNGKEIQTKEDKTRVSLAILAILSAVEFKILLSMGQRKGKGILND